jgi:hypothetical protein
MELAKPTKPTTMARVRAQVRTIGLRGVIKTQSRGELMTPRSHSRDGTARTIAIPIRRPTSVTHRASAWTGWMSTPPCWTLG